MIVKLFVGQMDDAKIIMMQAFNSGSESDAANLQITDVAYVQTKRVKLCRGSTGVYIIGILS